MKKLSKRDKRTIWGGSVVVIVILVVLYVVLPFFEAKEQVARDLEKRTALLEKTFQTIQAEQYYRDQVEHFEQRLAEYRRLLLDAKDETLARVQLEDVVRSLAEQNGVTIARSNPLQERKIEDRYVKISLQVSLQSGMSELTNFLYALSHHQKFLLVEDFAMNSFRVRNEVRLQPRMKISGFIRL